MGRNKIEIRKLETAAQRKATFAKRQAGLLNKAREIAVLCDVELALIVHTPKGEVLEECPHGNLVDVFKRYVARKAREHPGQFMNYNLDNHAAGTGREENGLKVFTLAELETASHHRLAELHHVTMANMHALEEFRRMQYMQSLPPPPPQLKQQHMGPSQPPPANHGGGMQMPTTSMQPTYGMNQVAYHNCQQPRPYVPPSE